VGVQIPRRVHSEVPHLGEVFRKLTEQKESRVEEGHLLPDHVHMLISIPPKYAVSQVIGFIKGKSAIHLARVYGEKKRNFVGVASPTSGASRGQARMWCGR
jgi:REP element-mobilizing transposase RayT